MLDFLFGRLIQKIKSQGILVLLDFTQQTVAQLHPFRLTHLALEHTLLHTDTIVLTGLRHAAQTPQASFLNGRNVVGDQDEHTIILAQAVRSPQPLRAGIGPECAPE